MRMPARRRPRRSRRSRTWFIGWIAAVLLILIVGSVVTGIFVVRSKRFHRYVLAKIVEKGNEATGGTVEIRGYDFHWTKLTAEAYGVIIHGLEKSNEKPLLEVDKLTLRGGGIGLVDPADPKSIHLASHVLANA